MNFRQGHALLIGVGSHQHHPHLDLPITVRDAQAVQAVLQNPALCGYPASQITCLSHAQATTAGILQALTALSQLASDQTLFLFFAGHGALGTNGRYHLLTHDVQLEGSRVKAGTGLSEELLLEKLRAIPAQRCLLLFNACQSGSIGPQTLGPEEGLSTLNPSGPTAHALLGSGAGRILITASQQEQYAYFRNEAKHTFFGQKLVDGLKGDAPSRTGFIGAFGLYEYLYHEVKEAAEAEGVLQEPVLTAVQTVGSFPVALYRGATALGTFAEGAAGLEGTAVESISAEKANRACRQMTQTGQGAVNIGDNAQFSGPTAIGNNARAIGNRGVYVEGDVTGHIQTGSAPSTPSTPPTKKGE